jgi:Transposase domain (DUF772)/Transposase DDE domain
MLIVGYSLGIRSERRLCEEVHRNLAYRWFCRLGLEDAVPNHSTFSKNRHGRFRESEAFRHVFESVVERCMKEGLVDGEGFAVDASVTKADANRRRSTAREETEDLRDPRHATRAVREYLTALDEQGESGTAPASILPTDPAARWTALSSSDFQWDEQADEYRCPRGKVLRKQRRTFRNLRTHITKAGTIIYRASQSDCACCRLKTRCCPNTPMRNIARSVHESAREIAHEIAKIDGYKQSREDRKKVEMLFAHLKRILKLDRLRLRGPSGAKDEFLLAAIAQLILAAPDAVSIAA